METSSLQKNQPHLESVLGPLSAEDDSKIRRILSEVDTVLLEIASHFGRDRAGWEGTGLELSLVQSGQVAISSNVSSSTPKGDCVDFCLELRPSWYFGERSSVLTWDIEFSIEADCRHSVDHSHMHTVNEVSVRVESAIDAAQKLQAAGLELKRLASEFSLEHWLEMASDTL
jgi:hypothetical protein